jgi:hypothetical protein
MLGRLPQIPTTAITVELPRVSKEEDDLFWVPHGDGAQPRQPGARSTTFHEAAALSKIVNSTLLLFFAPSQTMRGSILLGEYDKYKTWYSRLLAMVSSTKHAPSHVIERARSGEQNTFLCTPVVFSEVPKQSPRDCGKVLTPSHQEG